MVDAEEVIEEPEPYDALGDPENHGVKLNP